MTPQQRAAQLRDQILKTWSPPELAPETPIDQDFAMATQTASMLSIAIIMGREFMPETLTTNQKIAIDSGLRLWNSVFPDDGKCAFDGCENLAEFLACGKELHSEDHPSHPAPAHYCRTHMETVVDEGNPEYTAECPNCKCEFGVN